MTFRGRLRLFFTMIVIVPMIAIAVVLFSLTADSERGKADARLATGLDAALLLYEDGREAAADHARRIRPRLRVAVAAGDPRSTRLRLGQLVRSDPRIVALTLTDGDRVIRAGSPRGIAPATFRVERGGGGEGRLSVSVTDARALVRTVARRPRSQHAREPIEFLVLKAGRPVAGTAPEVRAVPGDSADFEVEGTAYRGRRVLAGRPDALPEEIAVFQEAGDVNSAITASRILIGSIIAAFLLLALATSVFVVRALQDQIGAFLSAARRLASGRFDQQVPTAGSDEFAELGREFNSMSQQLAAQMREVEGKRRQLQEMINRVGRALSSNSNPQDVLDLTVQTALEACGAQSARAVPVDHKALEVSRAGSSGPDMVGALEQAERAAGGRPGSAERDGVHALAMALRAQLTSRGSPSDVGVISIARRGEAFSRQEAELLEYLASQAKLSIENADLHATARRQAVTDELTGLPNQRHMNRALERELALFSRFPTPVGFVMLDLDNFKSVNDTYGHPQGDEVLMAVAGALREISRDIDEPARWGGEEFVVLLPQTDLNGAFQLAERMRQQIEQLRIPNLRGGDDLRVTASFGVASIPASARDRTGLVDAADTALYRAKSAGKNRVERAADAMAGSGAPPSS